MKQPKELIRIIKSVSEIVNHEEDVLGYKVKFKTSEVEEALEDLGYVLDYKQGSKKEKMFYHLPADPAQTRTPADENSLLDEVGGYILSRREAENYLANPAKKADEKKAAGELEKKVDEPVKPKGETTEIIPAPKGRNWRNWAYWSVGLLTAAVALRFLYSLGIPERKSHQESHQETVSQAEYAALVEKCGQWNADLSRCTQSLNAATYDPRGVKPADIRAKVEAHIQETKDDLYLGPGCGNAANELYARLNGVPEGRPTFLRALEPWDVCMDLASNPTKVVHYKNK